jgi:hypothetical protein
MTGNNIPDINPNYITEIFYFVPIQLAIQLQKSGEYIAALDWYRRVYAYDLPSDRSKIYYGLQIEKNVPPNLARSEDWLLQWLNPHTLASNRPNPYTRFTLMSIARCFMEFADLEFTRGTPGSISKARSLYMTARGLLLLPDLQTPISKKPDDIILPNPILETLVMHVDSNLSKLRQGRTISGMKRQIENYISTTSNNKLSKSEATIMLPDDLDNNGDIFNTSIGSEQKPVLRPTQYKYNVLIDRAKQLVNIAQQIEATYLSVVEKVDIENYNRMKAGFDLDLADSNKELHDLRVTEAQHNVDLANKQKERITNTKTTYEKYIPLNQYEQNMIDSYQRARHYKIIANQAQAATQIGQMGLNLAMAATPTNALLGGYALVTGIASGLAAIGGIARSAWANEKIIDAETEAQVSGIWASYERHKEQLQIQIEIAAQDLIISEQQITLANDHKAIIDKESSIATTQAVNARAVVEFLDNKFTNADLYEWMSGILGGVYRYFLLQATSMGLLAQNQLGFERQEKPPNFIRADYWQPPSQIESNLPTSRTNDSKSDRRGLTGSARLLQDIYQLDQFAFETNKRKLNLIQTFSLAQLFPFEFQQFRESGVLQFNTPMELFDRRFPGHFLRLIKRVRTSIVALIPPTQGIAATLATSGISRVVIGGEIFQLSTIRREPELVALTSPTNATGVFEMDVQSEMLLPFESMGVDTSWELQMPKAANQFDYNTIADVLITLEYTALNSLDYRQQIIRSMDNKISGDRQFSFKDDFPDQWYQLQNPDQVEVKSKKMVVNFSIERGNFPPNIKNLKIENILVYFAKSDSAKPFEVTARLAKGESTSDKDESTSFNGVISTRRGSWPKLNSLDKSPVGEWELSFRTIDQIKNAQIIDRFKKGDIEDVLFILTYKGDIPGWPI